MRAVFRYRLLDNLRAVGILLSALTLAGVVLPLTISLLSSGATGTFSTYSAAGMMFSLIIGIVASRVDLRLGNQLGRCRRSAFLGNTLGNLAAFAALSILITLVTVACQLFSQGNEQYVFVELYQLFYGGEAYLMPAADYLTMTLLNFAAFTAFGAFGALCSLAFWRVSRLGQWILGLGGGLLLTVGIPLLADKLGYLFLRPARILTTEPWAMLAFLLALAALGMGISWLLARKIHIRAQGK